MIKISSCYWLHPDTLYQVIMTRLIDDFFFVFDFLSSSCACLSLAQPHCNVDICALQFLDPNKGEKLESSTGRVASRDMIQFAPMKDVHGMHYGTELDLSFFFNFLL